MHNIMMKPDITKVQFWNNDDTDNTKTSTDIHTDTCPTTIQDTSYYAASPALAAKVPLNILSHTKNTHNSEETSMTNNIEHASD